MTTGVPFERVSFLAGGKVPDLDQRLVRRRGHEAPIRAERHRLDSRNVSLDRADLAAGVHVPENHESVVLAGGGQRLAVRAEPDLAPPD